MNAATKQTKVQQAIEQAKPLVDAIIARGGRCMEQVLDKKFGLVFERWLLQNGTSVVVMAAPQFREVFIEATPRQNSWDATFAALDVAAGERPAPWVQPLKDAAAYVELFTGNGVQEQPSDEVKLPNGDFSAQLIANNARAVLPKAVA